MSNLSRRDVLRGLATAALATPAALQATADPFCPVGPGGSPHDSTTDEATFNLLTKYGITSTPNFEGAPPFKLPASEPLGVRLSIDSFTNDGKRVEVFKTAYTYLKREPSEKQNLFNSQATIHEVACGDGQFGAHSAEIFFAWHRAFIYFHEKLLQRFSKDASLRLPYWNPVNFDTFPCLYTDPALSDLRSFDAKSKPEPVKFANNLRFLGSAKSTHELAEQMMGDWHFAVHTWVGYHMKRLEQAALDPLFYAWHSNVDRAWASTTLETSPMPEVWARFYKFFPEDSKGGWVYADLRTFCCETGKLGYKYDRPISVPKQSKPYFELRELHLSPGQSYNIYLKMKHGKAAPKVVGTITAPSAGSAHVHYPVAHYWPKDVSTAKQIKASGKFLLAPSSESVKTAVPINKVRLSQ